MVACSGSSTKQDSGQEGTEEVTEDGLTKEGSSEEEDPTNYEPPFTIIGVREDIVRLSNGEPGIGSSRVWYTIEVKKNGTYESIRVNESFNERARVWEYGGNSDGNKDIDSGRWTVSYRTIGETSQKVYDLHRASGKSLYYIPEDLEYFWCTALSEHTADWDDCANLNINRAIKVAEIITPKGTKVIIPENERIEPEPEVAPGPDIIGKTYEYVRNAYDSTNADTKEITKTSRVKISDKELIAEYIIEIPGEEPSHLTVVTPYKYKGGLLRLDKGIKLSDVNDSIYQMTFSEDGKRLSRYGITLDLVE